MSVISEHDVSESVGENVSSGSSAAFENHPSRFILLIVLPLNTRRTFPPSLPLWLSCVFLTSPASEFWMERRRRKLGPRWHHHPRVPARIWKRSSFRTRGRVRTILALLHHQRGDRGPQRNGGLRKVGNYTEPGCELRGSLFWLPSSHPLGSQNKMFYLLHTVLEADWLSVTFVCLKKITVVTIVSQFVIKPLQNYLCLIRKHLH